MQRPRSFARRGPPLALCALLAASLASAQTTSTAPPAKKKAIAKKKPVAAAPAPVLEPRAVDILKASSAKLAAARSMSFTALGAYEVPSLYGPPLIYGTSYEVTLRRPDRLKVISGGDSPVTEFYYDGKVMMSYHPAENLVAIEEAPPTIDAMLEKLFKIAGTYYPFTDAIVADPYGDIAPGLQAAFSVGPSVLVGGTKTDCVAYEYQGVFVQIWIGAEDKLPR